MNKNKNTVKEKKILTLDNQFRTLSIKCYIEQMPEGWEAVRRNIKVMDKSVWQVIGICHDRDPVGDDFWLPSIEKPHYHIIVRALDGKRPRVRQVLDALGIVYRPIVDKSLWENHGVETCKKYTHMAVYLTHDTEDAINDGKEQYELEELVSNLTIEEIRQIREGYTRVSESLEKVTPRMLAELDEAAYKLGYELGDFDAWYGSQTFNVRSNAKMRTVRESYDRGINKRLESGERVARLCVFIQSPENKGKSHAARYALEKLGKRYLDVSGQGTGKFDNLKVTHDAIIVDDDACGKHLLNLADTTYTRVYRRNKNNPVWAGDYLIVTSNLSFDDWLWTCGIYDKAQVRAARSRFYICELTKPKELERDVLYCTSRADRGGDDYLAELDEKYMTFKEYFNESLAAYSKLKNKRERVEINAVTVDESEPEAYVVMKEQEEAKQAARFEEDMRAEFEDSLEPDEYVEGIVMRWYMIDDTLLALEPPGV